MQAAVTLSTALAVGLTYCPRLVCLYAAAKILIVSVTDRRHFNTSTAWLPSALTVTGRDLDCCPDSQRSHRGWLTRLAV